METQVNSAFLNQIGLGSLDLGYFAAGVVVLALFVIILLILLIVQIRKANKLKKDWTSFS